MDFALTAARVFSDKMRSLPWPQSWHKQRRVGILMKFAGVGGGKVQFVWKWKLHTENFSTREEDGFHPEEAAGRFVASAYFELMKL